MTSKSMLIIGAGVAGLCTGSYAQMNGFSTRILELHSLPGGLCTSWKRGNYTVDGCLHWLVGSSPVNPMYHLWEELGVVQNHKFLYLDEFLVHESTAGKTLHLYRSLDKLEQHMLEYAPEDEKLIREFCGAARDMKKVEMPVDKAQETMGMLEGMGMMLKLMPKFGLLRKWGSITAEDYTKQFKNRELAEAINESRLPDFSLLFLLMTLAWLDAGDAGYALGGSLPIARTLEARYKSLGGEISYKTRVKKIIVENDKAVGVVLEDGTELRADIVVSCADGFHTIWDMLGGKYLDEKITKWYKETPIFQPLVHVALGCNRDFADVPHVVGGISIPIPKPLVIGEQRYQRLPLMVYNFDPGYAPSGKTVIKVMVQSRYDYWQKLAGDEKAYEAEKERIAREIVEGLESRFPGITNQIEMTDVATPLTFERYTGNWQGSFEGWMMTPKNWMKRVKKTLPGLGNFYMAGQWVEPGGGLPGGLMSGRNVVQLICKDNSVKFTTTKP